MPLCEKRQNWQKRLAFRTGAYVVKCEQKNRTALRRRLSIAFLQQDKNNMDTFIRYTFRFFLSFAEQYLKVFKLQVNVSIVLWWTPWGRQAMETTSQLNRFETSQNQSFLWCVSERDSGNQKNNRFPREKKRNRSQTESIDPIQPTSASRGLSTYELRRDRVSHPSSRISLHAVSRIATDSSQGFLQL